MKSIQIIFRSFTRTILRFYMPVIAGLLAFIFLLIELHQSPMQHELVHNYRFTKLFLECMSAISLYIAFDIFAEAQQLKFSSRIGLYLLGFCILGMHYYSITPGMFDSESIFISRYLIFIVCFHLMISFFAFHGSEQIQTFWQYNYFLLKRIVTSLLYSSTLFIGLSSALYALDKLFNWNINTDYYIELAAFIYLIFNTIFFLKGIPTSYEEFNTPLEFKKSIRIFVQYVLLPIIGIYITILYIYMFKIVFTRSMPNGWVCIPILIFSIIGILAYLLIYPIRLNQTNRSIFVYSKYFFYILLPLLSLYFIGIMKRIMPYGITEDRYLVFMLGVWIVIISIYIITSKKDNIIIIPVSLFLLLAISAVGPWGMFQLSVQNQLVRLEHLLKRNHLLENGKLIKLDKKFHVSKQDASSIRSIFSYLNKRGEIDQIHPWLGDDDQHKLDSAISKNDLVYVNSIFADLGPSEYSPYELHHTFVSIGNSIYHHPLNIDGYKHISQFDCSIDSPLEGVSNDSNLIRSQLTQQEIIFSGIHDSSFHIPIQEKFNQIIRYKFITDSTKQHDQNGNQNVHIVDENSQRMVIPDDTMIILYQNKKILLNTIEYVHQDSSYIIQRIEGLILD